MSSSNESQSPQPVIVRTKPRRGKGKKLKISTPAPASSSEEEVMISGSEIEYASDAVTASPFTTTDEEGDEPIHIEPVEGITVAEAEATVTLNNTTLSTVELIAEKRVKKGSKYTVEEVDAVKAIITKNVNKLVLSNKQLEIAKWIEVDDIKQRNAERKLSGMPSLKSEKASFCMEASFDKAYFLELQNQYTQEDGEIYTLQAFQHAINTWFFQHINIGNAYARSGGYKKLVETKSAGVKCVGVDMPKEFFRTNGEGFLQGYLLTDEGKAQLEIGEDLQRIKRTANKSAKGTNETKEQRARNTATAFQKMETDELEQQMMALQALMAKRQADKVTEDSNGSSAY